MGQTDPGWCVSSLTTERIFGRKRVNFTGKGGYGGKQASKGGGRYSTVLPVNGQGKKEKLQKQVRHGIRFFPGKKGGKKKKRRGGQPVLWGGRLERKKATP